jgi:1-acyl-sn-glycerol-3-phosphate acyltransferase
MDDSAMNGQRPDDLGYRLWMTTLRWLGRVLLHLGYRLRVEGTEHVPREGGVLVVSNHTAFHDWLFVGAALDRPPRFVMHQHHHQYPLLRAFFGASRVIPIAPKKEDPSRLAEAMEAIDRALRAGELVVIFPEGTMSPDGRLSPIRPGFERIVERTPVPTVPVAVSGLFGSSFSRAHGAPMSRWSGRVRAAVTVRFGAPLPADHVDVPTLARELSRLGGQPIGDEARAQLVHAAAS